MSAVTNTTILKQATLNVKSVLQAAVGTTIIDPKAGTRPTNQPFVRTTRARKHKYFPHIVVESFAGNFSLLSIKGDNLKVTILVQVSVFTKSIKDLDEIFSQLLEVMRTSRSTFHSYGMHRVSPFLTDISPILTDDEETHMRAATFQFAYYMG